MSLQNKLQTLMQLQSLDANDAQTQGIRQRIGFEQQRNPIQLQAMQQAMEQAQMQEQRMAEQHPLNLKQLQQSMELQRNEDQRRATSAPIENNRTLAYAVRQQIENSYGLSEVTKNPEILKYLQQSNIANLDSFKRLSTEERSAMMEHLARTQQFTPEILDAMSYDSQLAAFAQNFKQQ